MAAPSWKQFSPPTNPQEPERKSRSHSLQRPLNPSTTGKSRSAQNKAASRLTLLFRVCRSLYRRKVRYDTVCRNHKLQSTRRLPVVNSRKTGAICICLTIFANDTDKNCLCEGAGIIHVCRASAWPQNPKVSFVV